MKVIQIGENESVPNPLSPTCVLPQHILALPFCFHVSFSFRLPEKMAW